MRIAIVDDDAAERALLAGRIKASLGAQGHAVSALEYDSAASFLAEARNAGFDLVFMDIYMEGMDGIEAARALRAFAPDVPLVLTTTSREHALEGYRVRARQYLVKPYDASEIDVLVKEMRLLPPEPVIEVRDGRQSIRLREREILWADNFKHQIHIHMTSGRTAVVRMTFREFSGLLEGRACFFVCGRGVLVNLSHVRDFDGRAFQLPGVQVPVSRDLSARARMAFGEWLFCRKGEGGL